MEGCEVEQAIVHPGPPSRSSRIAYWRSSPPRPFPEVLQTTTVHGGGDRGGSKERICRGSAGRRRAVDRAGADRGEIVHHFYRGRTRPSAPGPDARPRPPRWPGRSAERPRPAAWTSRRTRGSRRPAVDHRQVDRRLAPQPDGSVTTHHHEASRPASAEPCLGRADSELDDRGRWHRHRFGAGPGSCRPEIGLKITRTDIAVRARSRPAFQPSTRELGAERRRMSLTSVPPSRLVAMLALVAGLGLDARRAEEFTLGPDDTWERSRRSRGPGVHPPGPRSLGEPERPGLATAFLDRFPPRSAGPRCTWSRTCWWRG